MQNSIDQGSTSSHGKIYPWVIWAVASSFFFASYFVRTAPSVMALHIMQDLNANALVLGVLAACFYYPYVAMQVPVGILVDKYGAHKLLSIMALMTALGCMLFASAKYVEIAYFSRVLIGFSAAFAFVGAIRLAASWQPSNRLGLIVGLTQGSGMLGAAFAAAPIATAVVHFGWRNTLWLIAFSLLGIAVLIALFARDNKNNVSSSDDSDYSVSKALKIIISNPQSWLNGIFVGFMFIPTGIFTEMWGITYLQQVHHVPLKTAALLNSLSFIGWAVGGPLIGWISDYIGRRRICMLLANIGTAITLSLILFVPNLPMFILGILLLLLGISSSGVGICYTLAAEMNSKKIAGTSLAFANMASVIVAAFLLPVIGMILDVADKIEYVNNVPVYSEYAFQIALSFPIVGLLIGCMLIFKIKETFAGQKMPNTNIN